MKRRPPNNDCTQQYRAVGERVGDTIEWAWIGSHNEFDSQFGS